jgi:CHAT domain-containing protein
MREVLWYNTPKLLSFGEGHAFEEAMRSAWTLGAISLGLGALTLVSIYKYSGTEKEQASRSIESRLTGVKIYTSCRVDPEAPDLVPDAICGQPRKPTPPEEGPRAVTTAARGARADDEGGESSRLLGSEQLVALDRTVKSLEQETAAEPGNAHLWNDLSAVALVRAQRADDPRDLLRAFEAADRALLAAPSLVEARFNRALALERLFLAADARTAWQSYLVLDGDSAWADEADRRLTALSGPPVERVWKAETRRLDQAALANDARTVEEIVGRFRQGARERAEQELLGEWGKAASAGQTARAEERLRIARSLGEALLRASGERLVHDAVAAIDEASRDGDSQRLRDLVQGYRDFGEGHDFYKNRDIANAVPKLTSALEALRRARSPFAVRADFFLACCLYLQGRYAQALVEMERLAGALEGSPYPAVQAHALWMKGLLMAVDGEVQAAADTYERARDIYQKLGEAENVAAVDALLGENRQLVGYGPEGWEHLYRALRASQGMLDPALASLVFTKAAEAASQDGFPRAALALQEQVVRYAVRCSPVRRLEALIWRARMEAGLGLRTEALRDLQAARRQMEMLGSSGQIQFRKADAAMIEGSLILREDARRAISLLTSALAVYQEQKIPVFALPALLARARARELAGDEAGAEQDLRDGLEAYESLGKSLLGQGLRLTFLATTSEVFDQMIAWQAKRDPDLAFAYADRALTRVLPGSASRLWLENAAEKDRLLAAELQPLPLREILPQLPADTTLVQFAVLPDRVLIWRLRRDGSALYQQPVRREALEQSAAKLQSSERHERAAWRKSSAELFDLLIRPWLREERKGERLVFVPDKVLHRVEFATLYDSAAGHFLIEDHTIAFAPSATLYVNALARRRRLGKTLGKGLVVGEPALDLERFPTLLPLPAAAEEARRLVELSGAVHLKEKEADKAAFLSAAPRADWIYFAGHAVIDPQNLLLSKLMLAPGRDGDPGWLTAREIYSLKLDGTRLVVLAACDTGDEYVPGSDGETSLARAFLAAGVPTVVATLRDVDDETTARLFGEFHQQMLSGADPADALREAQLAMLRSGSETDRSPVAWGPFEVIGASAH